jgi:hypothetical protein
MQAVAERELVARAAVPGATPATLEEVEAFAFREAVYKFVEYYDVDEAVAESFFLETKRWLWLCATTVYERAAGRSAPELLITGSLFWLDEMWHIFLQFTEEYDQFCRQYLGMFLHHRPTTRAEKSARRERLIGEQADYLKLRQEELRRQCHYVCEKLGEETFVRWYREYAERYSAAELFAKARLRQPAF